MNMREYWAQEASMMRDTSAILGNNALSAVPSPLRKKREIFFVQATGLKKKQLSFQLWFMTNLE
jgi:hypothetical protein